MARRWLIGWAVIGVVVSACGGAGDDAPAAESPPDVAATTADESAGEAPEDSGAPEGSDAPPTSVADDEGSFTPLAPGEGTIVGAAGTEVTSDDGRLVLTFPAGAVAEDTVVAVRSLPAEEWPDVLAGADRTSRAYRLEPSGLTFDQPVAFALTTELALADGGSVRMPLAILIDDEGTGEPVGLQAALDPGAGVSVVSGELEHFSMLWWSNGGLEVQLEQVSPKERKIGEPWEARAEVVNGSMEITTQDGTKLSVIRDFTVTDIAFEGGGAVQVVGSTSHPGFTLAPGTGRRLDSPVPRWQCVDVDEGTYQVVAEAPLDESQLSATLTAVRNWVWGMETSLVARVRADVDCELPQYNASGGGTNLSVSGTVDITEPFTLQGAIVGGNVTLNFTPAGVHIDPEAMRITSDGTFTYSGGGSDARISGSGTYDIDGPIGKPLTLHHDAGGCANPGECKDTEGGIVLTPIG